MLNLQQIINYIWDFSNKCYNTAASRNALNAKNQKNTTFHSWHLDLKKKIFAWLLNPVAKNKNCFPEKSEYLIINLFVF